MSHVGNDRLDLHFGVDSAELIRGRDRLRQSVGDVLFIVEHLPLQIVELEKIAVDDSYEAHPCAYECFSHDGSQRATSAHQRASFPQLLLAFVAQGRVASLAIVSGCGTLAHCCFHPVPGAKSTGRRGASRRRPIVPWYSAINFSPWRAST